MTSTPFNEKEPGCSFANSKTLSPLPRQQWTSDLPTKKPALKERGL